jgi:hypothetical protein
MAFASHSTIFGLFLGSLPARPRTRQAQSGVGEDGPCPEPQLAQGRVRDEVEVRGPRRRPAPSQAAVPWAGVVVGGPATPPVSLEPQILGSVGRSHPRGPVRRGHFPDAGVVQAEGCQKGNSSTAGYQTVHSNVLNKATSNSWTLDNRCEDGRFLVSARSLTISNPNSLSSSETGINRGIRS